MARMMDGLEAAVSVEARVEGQDGGHWPFADDPDWQRFVDNLSAKQAAYIANSRLHVPSARSVHKALAGIQSSFTARDFALEMMVACAISGTNLVFLGPPGTAKSLMVRAFAQKLGIRRTVQPIQNEQRSVAELRRVSDAIRKGEAPPENIHLRRMFEYLVTKYTTPEELPGAADIQTLVDAGVHFRSTIGLPPQAEPVFLQTRSSKPIAPS